MRFIVHSIFRDSSYFNTFIFLVCMDKNQLSLLHKIILFFSTWNLKLKIRSTVLMYIFSHTKSTSALKQYYTHYKKYIISLIKVINIFFHTLDCANFKLFELMYNLRVYDNFCLFWFCKICRSPHSSQLSRL